MNFGQWLGLLSLIISLYIIWEIRVLLLLLFAAVVLATALNRLTNLVTRRLKIKRSLAIPFILIILLLFFILFLIIILPPFIEQFKNLVQLLPTVWEVVNQRALEIRESQLDWLSPLPRLTDIFPQLQRLGTQIFTNFVNVFSNSFTGIFQILLVFVLTLMLVANPKEYRGAFLKLFPSFYRRRADEILDKTEIALVNWLTGIVITSFFIGCLSAIGLWILQVKLVLAHAVLAGLFNFIPNIGPTMSVLSPILITVLDDPWKIIAIVIWYVIIQNLESYWLTPTIMSKQVSLLPAVTLIAQIFFASIFGVLGLLLALPLTVVAKTWIDEVLFVDILDKWHSDTKKEEG